MTKSASLVFKNESKFAIFMFRNRRLMHTKRRITKFNRKT